MKKLFAIGDSLTAGAECIADEDMTEENKQHAYPMYIANKLNYDECINRALPGATNEWIARRCVQDLEELKRNGEDLKNIFVVVGWSSINRGEVSVRSIKDSIAHDQDLKLEFTSRLQHSEMNHFETLFINPNLNPSVVKGDGDIFIETCHETKNFFGKYIWDYELEYERWYTNILFLKNYLQNNVGNFLFHNNIHPCEVKSSCYDFVNYYDPTGESFNEWATTNNYNRMKLYHPVEKAHGDYSRLLCKYIEENL